MTADTRRLSSTFDEDAELYDRARPGYPTALFDDLVAFTALRAGSRVLEIGPGTGQATLPLARLGCRIEAVEQGPNLAAVAARRLASFPDVTVVVSGFEDWPLPPTPYDLVISATAFHWIDPAIRAVKSGQALRPGGSLAVVETHHVAGGDEQFFTEAQECYERFDPSTPPGLRLLPAVEIPYDAAELIDSGLFEPPAFRRYETDIDYSTATYRDVLLTYSGHRALPDDARRGLLDCLADLIDRRYGGRITKRYLTQLVMARRIEHS